jgi:hypothetical protein
MGALAIAGNSGNSGIVQQAGAVAPPGPVAPEWLEFEVTTTAANQTYAWAISGTGISATTQWGDGTTTTTTTAGNIEKTYAAAGVYTVRIQAAWTSSGLFNLRPTTDRTRVTRLLSPIPNFPGLVSLVSFCNGCSGITGSIPVDLLRYVVNVTSLLNFFNGCSGITGSIPVDLLRYVVNATNLQNFFSGCTRLQMQADILGPDPDRFLNQNINFASAFRNVGTLAGTPQGTAPPLWTYTYGGAPATTLCFAGNSATNLSNWAQIPIAWGGPA